MPIQIIESEERFLELEPAWRKLHASSPTAHLFNGFDWLHAWWLAFARPQDALRIYGVRREGKLIGLLPLYRPARSPGPRGLAEPRLLRSFFNHYLGRTDLLSTPDPSVTQELLTALAQDRDHYDVCQLDQLPEASPTFLALAGVLPPGLAVHAVRNLSSPYLPLTGGYEAWYQTRYSSRRRQQDRRRLRNAEKLGPTRLEVLKEPELVRAAFERGLEVEAKSWKGQEASAIAQDPRTATFMRTVVERYAARGQVRLIELSIGAAQAAFLLGFVEGGCFYFHKTGYDPAFEEVSPGRQVLLRSLEQAFGEGLSRYDFLGAPDPYKLECSPLLQPHATAFLYPEGLRAQLFRQLKRTWVPSWRRLRGQAQPFEPRIDR
ncbi:MAG: GNAT family N-acetyltransferase [Deltaproteobacteria bacterium]|jgi:CelD/BcsL family acetyltransferase involved in cellulose biosynthesis|nr:GNAT family N-acetyltransferase [Deltaproteobacteria bacterium]